MGLFSAITRRRDSSSLPAATVDSADTVQAERAKARHRLIGAVVLLLVGILGFPLVFETQPRPTPVDVVIEIPRKETAPALVVPVPRAPSVQASAPVAALPLRGDDVGAARKAESASASAPAASAKPEPKPASLAPQAAPAPKPVANDSGKTSAAPGAKPNAPAATPAAASAEPAGARFVVQVGAFADTAAAQLMRAKAEKLGLKTYTQLAETAAGNRVRVRIGPFATREAAEQALAKAKAGGLNAVVLTL